jgi:hypothetical protein
VEAARTRYEVRVGTVVSAATLATFRLPVRPTAVPRNTVYRIRVHTNRDLSELLHRLTEHDVQVLEIRRCAEPSRPSRPSRPVNAPPPETADLPAAADGVVLPFRERTRSVPTGADPGFHPVDDDSAG